MNELPNAEPAATTTDASAAAEPTADVPDVDENGRPPAQAQWHADMVFARHLVYDRALSPYAGYTVAIYERQIVGKGKDFKRLLNRVTKQFGIESWQVILIDPEDGIM
jgi:hypothetical protein